MPDASPGRSNEDRKRQRDEAIKRAKRSGRGRTPFVRKLRQLVSFPLYIMSALYIAQPGWANLLSQFIVSILANNASLLLGMATSGLMTASQIVGAVPAEPPTVKMPPSPTLTLNDAASFEQIQPVCADTAHQRYLDVTVRVRLEHAGHSAWIAARTDGSSTYSPADSMDPAVNGTISARIHVPQSHLYEVFIFSVPEDEAATTRAFAKARTSTRSWSDEIEKPPGAIILNFRPLKGCPLPIATSTPTPKPLSTPTPEAK